MIKQHFNARFNALRTVSLWILAAVFMLTAIFCLGGGIAFAEPEDIGGDAGTDHVLTVSTNNLISARLKGQAAYKGQDTSALCAHNGAHIGDGAGATFQFDLCDINIPDGWNNYIAFNYNRLVVRDTSWYSGINDNFQTVIRYYPKRENKRFLIGGSNGSLSDIPDSITGDDARFMQKGYTYRVTIEGESNSFIAERKPIALDDGYFEEILRFSISEAVANLNVAKMEGLADYEETYAFFGLNTAGSNNPSMVVDNVSMWRPNDKENTIVSSDFNGNLKFDSYQCKMDNTNYPEEYGNDWEKYSTQDAHFTNTRMGWYYNDESLDPSDRIYVKCTGFTEANLTDGSAEWNKINDNCDVSVKSAKVALPNASDVATDSEKVFLGWTDGEKLYKEGEELLINKGNFTAAEIDFSIIDGASVRIAENIGNSGIRFSSRFNTADMAKIAKFVTEFGTLIIPVDTLTDTDNYTDFILDGTFTAGETILQIESTVQVDDEEAGYTRFNGAMINILAKNYDRTFAGRGYLKVTYADESTAIFYTGVVTRSIKEVAAAALASESHNPEQTAILNAYAGN